jgi:PhnB protein
MAVKPVPEGFRTLTPHLVVSDAAAAIEFYKRAFGGQERMRMPGPGGKVMHAELQIGDSIFMLNDEFPEMGARSPISLGGSPVTLMLYVPNVDQTFAQAVSAGATAVMPVSDQFWGDRYGMVKDPFGHQWAIATHMEDLTPAQIGERHAAAFAAGK